MRPIKVKVKFVAIYFYMSVSVCQERHLKKPNTNVCMLTSLFWCSCLQSSDRSSVKFLYPNVMNSSSSPNIQPTSPQTAQNSMETGIKETVAKHVYDTMVAINSAHNVEFPQIVKGTVGRESSSQCLHSTLLTVLSRQVCQQQFALPLTYPGQYKARFE